MKYTTYYQSNLSSDVFFNTIIAIGDDGLLCQSRAPQGWHGARSNRGVRKSGGLLELQKRCVQSNYFSINLFVYVKIPC